MECGAEQMVVEEKSSRIVDDPRNQKRDFKRI
jgi:hypothetical protein